MDFPHDIDQFELISAIGHGSSSHVYSARCRTNDKELAIKEINLDQYAMELDIYRQEVAFWSACQHPNIVGYYGSFVSGPNLYILMEYLEAGSLYDIINKSFPKGFDDEVLIASILKFLLRALEKIHSQNQIHRDVKPGNVLISAKGEVKLGDFGVAASLLEAGQRKRARYTITGTPCYMAPEVLQEEGYTEKADIWSFGISAIELVTGEAPYSALPPMVVVQKIIKSPPPQLPMNAGYSSELRELIRSCLNYDAKKRLAAHELMKLPFFLKAKGENYIEENLVKGLPRIAQLKQINETHSADFDELSLLRPAPGFGVPSSLPNPSPLWSFDENEEEKVIHKGRFNFHIRKHSSKTSKSPLEPNAQQQNSSEDIALATNISILENQIEMLVKDQQEMKTKLKQLIDAVQKLSK